MRTSHSHTILVACALLLTGCAGSHASPEDMQKRQQALANSDRLIVRGERIGPVRLGMSTVEVLATLGEPDRRKNGIVLDNGSIYSVNWEYWSLNLDLTIDGNSPTPSVTMLGTSTW